MVHDSKPTHQFSSEDKVLVQDWMKALIKATISRNFSGNVVFSRFPVPPPQCLTSPCRGVPLDPVHLSSQIETMTLEEAQSMNPPPRPPSPTSRARVQAAYYRDRGSLTEAQAKALITPSQSPVRQSVTTTNGMWTPKSSSNPSSAQVSPTVATAGAAAAAVLVNGSPSKPISPAKSVKRKGVQRQLDQTDSAAVAGVRRVPIFNRRPFPSD
jgi:hypothetical protein